LHHYYLTLISGGGPLCTIQRLKPICDALLSSVAFNFNLRRHNVASVELLLKHSAVVDFETPHARTALMSAAVAGQLESLQMLLTHKARVDRESASNDTALILAAEAGRCRLTLSNPF